MNVFASTKDTVHDLACNASFELLQEIIAAVPAGIIVLSGTGQITYCNALAQRLLDLPLIGQSWSDIVTEVFHPRADDGYEVSLRDGRRLSLATAPLLQQAGQLVYMSDVTPSRNLQERTHHRQRLQALGNMALSLAHQIRTPLSAAVLYASHLGNHAVDEIQRRRFSEKLLERLQELERQINDVLLYARGSECQAVSQVTWKEIFNLLAEEIDSLHIKDQLDVDYPVIDENWRLTTNAHVLKGIFLNLILNATQAHATKVVLKLTQNASSYVIEVRDNGQGIDPQAITHIFEPFFTTKARGTGLGLAIVKTVVQAHGGKVEVKTRKDYGTSFYLSFPIEKTQLLPQEVSV